MLEHPIVMPFEYNDGKLTFQRNEIVYFALIMMEFIDLHSSMSCCDGTAREPIHKPIFLSVGSFVQEQIGH